MKTHQVRLVRILRKVIGIAAMGTRPKQIACRTPCGDNALSRPFSRCEAAVVRGIFMRTAMPSPSRPFLNRKAAELRTIFEANKGHLPTLQALLFELSHRTTQQASKLRAQVQETIATLDNGAPSDKEAPFVLSAAKAPSGFDGVPTPIVEAQWGFDDYLAPPWEFTSVQPVGVEGRPLAYKPPLRADIRLNVNAGDRKTTIFRVALDELIDELKRNKKGSQQFTLANGPRGAAELGNVIYQFDFPFEANVFEGAKVQVVIAGRTVDGQLAGILPSKILISLVDDFGPSIASCILRIDNTALLQALRDRLLCIERGEMPTFRLEFAESVLTNKLVTKAAAPKPTWPWQPEPNQEQQEFIRLALTNEIVWLWGPPGTGKTDVLSVLTFLLFKLQKRVLICSNTNQAVDQVLLKLCDKLKNEDVASLHNGSILRLGRLDSDTLRERYESFITVEGIIARKSKALLERRQAIADETGLLDNELKRVAKILDHFAALDKLIAEANASTAELRRREAKVAETSRARDASHQLAANLQAELNASRNASFFGSFFVRSEAAILKDLSAAQQAVNAASQAMAMALRGADEIRPRVLQSADAVTAKSATLDGQNRSALQERARSHEDRRRQLNAEIADIAKQIDGMREAVPREARVVAATITRTFLRPNEFSQFDAVIIDEASMILLPAAFYASGLAKERVVVAGDFRQLPPIVQTEQQAIHSVLGHGIFTEAGIEHAVDNHLMPQRLVQLREQFRMDPSICRIVSDAYYDGTLVTSPLRKPSHTFLPCDPITDRLTIIDTSRVWPVTNRNLFKSRFNLMHALAIRNLVLHMVSHDPSLGEVGAIGLCTPYSAQADLLCQTLVSRKLDKVIRASTAHRFQGDERHVLVLDLVDSVGERNAGIFLQSNHRDDAGAKLFNVAFSRAREALVVVGNLTYLDKKLPGDAVLRGLLHELHANAKVVDISDVLALYPIVDDLKQFGPRPSLDPSALRTGLFGGDDFTKLALNDIALAKESVVIFSGFITQERVAQLADVLRAKIMDGVGVRCVTRPPSRNGMIPVEHGKTALKVLEGIGAAIDLRQNIHEKAVIVDSRIAWFGSLNPLSHTTKTSELMARVDDQNVAQYILKLLSVRSRGLQDDSRDSSVAENPRCERCKSWSVYIIGKHGPFFACEANCGWKVSVDRM